MATPGARAASPHHLGQRRKVHAAGGKRHFAPQIDDANAVIEIEDTGLGIAENELPQFSIASIAQIRHVRERFAGQGLGLAIAQWIAEMHKGTIEVESKVGEGTRMRIKRAQL